MGKRNAEMRKDALIRAELRKDARMGEGRRIYRRMPADSGRLGEGRRAAAADMKEGGHILYREALHSCA